jgi:oxygen-dependent protoporphyrinogen oxidase
MKKHIIVIGGGMAGTAATNTLIRYGYDVTIIEKNNYLGGRVHTRPVQGTAIEMGACFMTNFYTNLQAFLADNKLDSHLYKSRSIPGIVRGGQVRMATFKTLAGNSALSWKAKAHLVALTLRHLRRWGHLDHHAFWKSARYDTRPVSASFSAANSEVLEYLLQPGLNGYLYWTPEHTSEAIISNLFKAGLGWRTTYRIQGGLQRIPEQAAIGSTVLLGHAVKEVVANPDGTYRVWATDASKDTMLEADGIVCATTASIVPRIFHDLDEQQKLFFQSIQYSSTALVARVYQQHQTRGSKSIAFPRQENIPLSALTIWPEPGGKSKLAALKTYASGTIGRQLCMKSDKEIIRTLVGYMEPVRESVLVGEPTPLETYVQRWPEALPFFDVGHLKRLESFEKGDIERPGRAIVFAGDYLGGPFMEGAFTSGIQAAERLHARIS